MSPSWRTDRRPVELQVDVGGAGVDGAPQERVEIHLDSVVGMAEGWRFRCARGHPSARSGTRARPRCSPGAASSPSSSRSMLRQRSCVRATRQSARGQRSSARFSFHEARCSGASAASTRALVGLERRGAAARAGRGSPPRRAATETKHSYIPSPETGSISPAASPTSSARSPAIRVAGPAQRQPVAAQALELRRVEPVRLRRRARGARGSAALRPARRRRRR